MKSADNLFDKHRDGTIKSGVELPETLACKVRSDLQREGIEELQALVNEGATALGQQFSEFEDLKKAFVNYLLYAGYENLIGRVSNEDRDELVDIAGTASSEPKC